MSVAKELPDNDVNNNVEKNETNIIDNNAEKNDKKQTENNVLEEIKISH